MMKMEQKWVWVWVWMVLLMFVSLEGYWWSAEVCLEQERSALLQLKQFSIIENWAAEKNSNCCQWDGVVCSYTTQRVVVLNLFNRRLHNYGGWLLNASVFSPFKQLEELFLTGNNIAGCVENEGFDRLSGLSSLNYLHITDNMLKQSIDRLGLCELVHLQVLDVSRNNFVGTLPRCLGNLTSLKYFAISQNQFMGNISLSPLMSMTSIIALHLQHNHFQIPMSLEPFFNHSKLEEIYVDYNKIYAETESNLLSPKFQLQYLWIVGCIDCVTFPKFLYHQNALISVDLSHTNLKGEFPNWLFENNTQLEQLDLSDNFLSGLVQFKNHSCMNLMTWLDISNNSFHGPIPTEVGAYLPSLIYLNANQNAFDGTIPSSFGDIKSLNILDLSVNQLSGKIPEHLAMGCFSLQILVLSDNRLQGQIFSTKLNLTNLLVLRLDGNQFTGSIPGSLSNCSLLVELYLGDNYLSGRIPGWLGNMSSLYHLTMPKNHLDGPIPMEFCQLSKLEILDLAKNAITGSLPSCFSPPVLQRLHLSENRLQGRLNDALGNAIYLFILDLSYNYLNGSIPSWIYSLSSLSYLKLSNNNFEGEVPFQLCLLDKLRLLDLSHNNVFGHIPPCLAITDRVISPDPSDLTDVGLDLPPLIYDVFLEFTTKNNSYSYQERILTYMTGIDLSCNKLTGEIPLQIGQLNSIRALNLSHNNLIGSIPSTLSKLKQIESLDLSYNNLNGTIPPELVELNTLEVFSVAHNNLSGKVPDRTAQFITFEEGSYEGNPLLCGLPVPKPCNTTGLGSLSPGASVDNGEGSSLTDMDIFYISFIVAYIFAVLAVALVLYINSYWRRTWFYFVETTYYFIVDHLP